jgi:hypothetical protein
MNYIVYLNGVDHSLFIIPEYLQDVLLADCKFPIEQLFTGTRDECKDFTANVEKLLRDFAVENIAQNLLPVMEMDKEHWDQWLKDQFDNDPEK